MFKKGYNRATVWGVSDRTVYIPNRRPRFFIDIDAAMRVAIVIIFVLRPFVLTYVLIVRTFVLLHARW